MTNAGPRHHRIFRDPSGTVHALAVVVPIAPVESVLVTMCGLRFPAQVVTPVDSAQADVTCADCLGKLAAGW